MTQELIKELHDALAALLKRDMRNTCTHEETHRGGSLWEICDQCGLQWADDRGGKPEWKDPDEWGKAQDAIDRAKKALEGGKRSELYLTPEERLCLVDLIFNETERYKALTRENTFALPIMREIDAEIYRLERLIGNIKP